MFDFGELALKRRSIRKFEKRDIDVGEIIECVKIATTAPSGCDSQCWEFVIIHGKEKIDEIANIVAREQEKLLAKIGIEYDKTYYDARIKALTFFKNAPVCIAVYMTKIDYYDKKVEKALFDHGYSYEELMRLFGSPDILSIGAAIQNLLLAITEKGYGACWMNDPIVAKDAISRYLGMSSDKKLISLLPVGIPAYTPRGKKYKDIKDAIKVIE